MTLAGGDAFKDTPKLCRAKRLLGLAGGLNTDLSPSEIISFQPNTALAQAACVPALLGEALKSKEKPLASQDGVAYVPFHLARRSAIPLFILHDAPLEEPWFDEFELYLDDGAARDVFTKIDHPFDIPALHVSDNVASITNLVGTSDSVALWGALGLLGLRCTVDEMGRVLDGAPLPFANPQIIGVNLKGSLPEFTGALDIAYHLMDLFARRYGPNKIVEFYGDGLEEISLEMRQEICLQSRFMDAHAMLWPADGEALRGVSDKQAFKAAALALGLWRNDGEHFDYDDIITINLGSLKPGYPLTLTPPDPLSLDTKTWYPPYVSPTGTHPNTPLPVTRAVVVLGAHSKAPEESVVELALLLENAAEKQLHFKVPTTFFIHKDHLIISAVISQMCEHILKLKGRFELHNLPFGTHVVTGDGATLLTSHPFACVFALTGSTYVNDLPDLSPTATLKDIWPSLEDIRVRVSGAVLPPPPKIQSPTTKTRPFWAPLTCKNQLAADIENARPLPILRHHDLTFSLLARGPIPTQNDEPFEAYRANPHFLTLETKQVIKRYIPKICESYLEDDVPLVLFGGHCYGRGGDWAWGERALSLIDVRVVVAYSFDPLIHRAFLSKGIVPLHWMAPLSADDVTLDGRERISITGINTASTSNHVVTMSLTHGAKTTIITAHARSALFEQRSQGRVRKDEHRNLLSRPRRDIAENIRCRVCIPRPDHLVSPARIHDLAPLAKGKMGHQDFCDAKIIIALYTRLL